MAEETATPAPAKEEAGTNGEAKPKRDNKKREEQKPIEELYDLSQPIPRVSPMSKMTYWNPT